MYPANVVDVMRYFRSVDHNQSAELQTNLLSFKLFIFADFRSYIEIT